MRILLSIPVTVASGERGFSKLKLIKTYLRSTISQSRLTKEFADRKARKVKFISFFYIFFFNKWLFLLINGNFIISFLIFSYGFELQLGGAVSRPERW